jgi:hypothetical protein
MASPFCEYLEEDEMRVAAEIISFAGNNRNGYVDEGHALRQMAHL